MTVPDLDEGVAHYTDSDVDAIRDTFDFGRFFFGVPAIVNSGNRRPFGVFSACVRIGKAIFGCRACARRRARGLRIAATGRQKKFRLLWGFRLSFFRDPKVDLPDLDEDAAHYPDLGGNEIWGTFGPGRKKVRVPAIVNSVGHRVSSACVRIRKAILGFPARARCRAHGLRNPGVARSLFFPALW